MMTLRIEEVPKPYSVVRKWAGFFYGFTYLIQYEETTILIGDSRKDAESIVAALNGAYREGWLHAEKTANKS